MTGSTASCLSLEEISAFADDGLEQAERAAALTHVASCERCLELLAETTRTLESVDPIAQAERGAVAASTAADRLAPRSATGVSRWRAPLALAAAVLLAVTALAYLRVRARTEAIPAAEAIASIGSGEALRANLPTDWQEQSWSVPRGATQRAAGNAASFRIGVEAMNLAVALQARDAQIAALVSARLDALLESLADPGATAALILITPLRQALATGADEEAFALTEELEGVLESATDERSYRAGRWAAAGRAAQLTGAEDHFRSRIWQRGLHLLEASHDAATVELGGALRQASADAAERGRLLERLIERAGDGELDV